MKLMKTLCGALVGLLLSQAILAADIRINALPAASGMSSTDLTLCDQGGVTRICTGAQLSAMVLTTPNIGVATGTSLALSGLGGSGTLCVHVNNAGLLSTAGADCGTGTGGGGFSGLTSGTNTAAAMVVGSGSSLAVAGTGAITATSLATLTGLPAIANGTVIGNGAGSTTSPTALVLSGNLFATPNGLTTAQAINTQTGTTYTVLASDSGKLVTFSNAGAVAVGLPQAGTTGFGTGYSFDVQNKGAGTVTITPATSTINASATLSIPQNQGCTVTSDGTNYQVSACTALVAGGGGGSSAWNALTSGTNTTGAFLVGSGASLGTTGTGTLQATSLSALTGIPSIATQTVLGNGTGSSGAPAALALGPNLLATATTLGFSQALNAQTGTTYTFLSSDAGKLVTFNNASAIAAALPQATTTGFTSGFSTDIENLGAGSLTITPTTSTINGAATLVIPQNRGCTITSNGTNYVVSACTALGSGTGVSSVGLSMPAGWSVSNTPVTTSGTLTASFSGPVVGGTKFTLTPTGCTPSATTGGGTAGTITLASGPCTSIVITMNGATGLTATNGWNCDVHDRTATTIPKWGESASSVTTATIPVPAAVGATDVLSFKCTGF
jgi:fibronectin-binding autotransporter adhesin